MRRSTDPTRHLKWHPDPLPFCHNTLSKQTDRMTDGVDEELVRRVLTLENDALKIQNLG